tara:strand:+ start:224 stop:373 length:150 start_codon:yes stop_codon:yes gene_type:complete
VKLPKIKIISKTKKMEKNLKMEIWLFLITRQQLMVKILKEEREKIPKLF